jgi:hypothetical protein
MAGVKLFVSAAAGKCCALAVAMAMAVAFDDTPMVHCCW